MDALKLLRLALTVLTDRLLTMLSLLMTFALAVWVMQEPLWERMAMCAFFAVAVFLPCLMKERKSASENHQEG